MPRAAHLEAAKSSATSATVLIVDDEGAILEFISETLTDEGYHVVTTSNSRRALNIVRQVPLVLILTDYMMPHLNGVELAQQLRADPRTSVIPLVLMSAVPPADVTLFAALIRKPFDLDDLVAQVHQHQRLQPSRID